MRSARGSRDALAGRRATDVIARGLTARLRSMQLTRGMASRMPWNDVLLGRDQCVAFLVFQGRRSGKGPRWCRANPSYGLAAPGRNRKSNEWHDKRLVLLVWSLLIAIRARYRFSIPHTVEIADSGSFLISPLLLKIGRRTPGNLFLLCLPRCDLDSRCRCNLQGTSSHSSFRVSVHIPTQFTAPKARAPRRGR